jgi:hypothetical protein
MKGKGKGEGVKERERDVSNPFPHLHRGCIFAFVCEIAQLPNKCKKCAL